MTDFLTKALGGGYSGAKKISPMLARADISIVPEPFDPDAEYRAALKDEHVVFRPLKEQIDRFPPQPPFPDRHRALSAYFWLESDFSDGQLITRIRIIDRAFIEQIREKSKALDIERRMQRRSDTLDDEYMRHVRHQELEAAYWTKEFFERVYLHSIAAREVYGKLADAEHLKRIDRLQLRQSERDEEILLAKEAYEAAVLKAMEKHPREITLAGTALQEVLRELSDTDSSSVFGAMRKVRTNMLELFAEQLNDRLSQGLPNAVLYSASVKEDTTILHSGMGLQAVHAVLGSPDAEYSAVHRIASKVNDNFYQAHADQLDDHMNPERNPLILYNRSVPDYRAAREVQIDTRDEDRHERVVEETRVVRHEQHADFQEASLALTSRTAEAIAAYWKQFDARHETILKTISTATTNRQSMLTDPTKLPTQKLMYFLGRTERNVLSAHADALNDHVKNPAPPGIERSVSVPQFDRPEHLEETHYKASVAEGSPPYPDELRQRRDESVTEAGENRAHLANVAEEKEHAEELWHHMESLRTDQGREAYWKVYDHLNQETLRAGQPMDGSDLSEQRQRPFEAPSHAHHSLRAQPKEMLAATDETHLRNQEIQNPAPIQHDPENRTAQVLRKAVEGSLQESEQAPSPAEEPSATREVDTKKDPT